MDHSHDRRLRVPTLRVLDNWELATAGANCMKPPGQPTSVPGPGPETFGVQQMTLRSLEKSQ